MLGWILMRSINKHGSFSLLSVFYIQPPIMRAVAVVLYADYEFKIRLWGVRDRA